MKLVLARTDIQSIERTGQDLLVKLADGSVIRIENYFECEAQSKPQIVLAEEGSEATGWLINIDEETCGPEAAEHSLEWSYAPLVADAAGMGILPIVGLGALVVGGIAVGAGGGGGDSGGGGNNPPPDTTPPAPPVINPTNGSELSGTAENGSTIDLDLDGDGTSDASVTTDGSGNWTYTPDEPIEDGTEVTATATDDAGNTSDPATQTVDGSTPRPTIDDVDDNAGSIVGSVANGGVTDDTTPTISGSGAEGGATITIYDGNTALGTTTADGSGDWSFTPGTALGEGTHSFTAVAEDALGNTSTPSPAYAVTIDTTAPDAPTIDDTNGSEVTGTAEPGSTVNLDTDGDGEPDETVPVDDEGDWSFTPDEPIPDGTEITATATDEAGNTSGPATETVDSDLPDAAPTIDSIVDDVTAITGVVEDGEATNDNRPTISGSGAAANATVSIYDGETLVGTTTANGAGNWTLTVGSALSDGEHAFTAVSDDGAGHVSAPSDPYTITVDTVAPAAPEIEPTDGSQVVGTAEPNSTVNLDTDGDGTPDVTVPVDDEGNWIYTPADPIEDDTEISATATDAAGNTSGPATETVDADAPPPPPTILNVMDDVGSITGNVVKGGVTDDTRPAISGKAGANVTVTIFSGATQIGTVIADDSGNWTFTPASALSEGLNTLTAKATNESGETSPASAGYAINVDTTPPPAPTIAPTNGEEVSGMAEPGSAVSLDIDGNGTMDVTVPVNGAGNWSYTPASPIPDGTTITARATDPAGNTSAPDTEVVDVDVQTIDAPVIDSVTDDFGALTGTISNGGVTDDNRPTLSGSGAVAGGTVTIYDGATMLGTTTANGSGNWSFTPASPLTDGTRNLTATVSDDGVTSPPSGVYAVVVDTVAPAAPVISPTNGSQISGTAEANVAVHVDIGNNGSVEGTVMSNGAGNWTYTPASPVANGTTVSATASDAAGNTSGPDTEVVDRFTPVPAIDAVIDDEGDDMGTIASGATTDDDRPELQGSGAEANATISIYDGAALLGTTLADGSGDWSFTPSSPLADDTYDFTVTGTDALGNVSAASSAYSITVDTSGPPAPLAQVEITTLTEDTGTVGDWQTEDLSPEVGGTLSQSLAAGESVQVRLDGGSWLNANVSGTEWSYAYGAIGEGNHTVDARVIGPTSLIGDTDSQAITILDIARAPIVQASDADLLGLISAETLGLIDFNGQAFKAFDPDNNIVEVEIKFASTLNLDLAGYSLTANETLATSLGLEFSVDNDGGLLGLLGTSSTLTVTAIDDGPIDNVDLNQFLATVHFTEDVSLVGLALLPTVSIDAWDQDGLSDSVVIGSLVDLTLLNNLL